MTTGSTLPRGALSALDFTVTLCDLGKRSRRFGEFAGSMFEPWSSRLASFVRRCGCEARLHRLLGLSGGR